MIPSMCAAALPTSWEPRLASWRPRSSLASFRGYGDPIIRGWSRASGSTKAVNRRLVQPSIISSGLTRRITRSRRRRRVRARKFSNFSSGASSRVRQTRVRRRCLPATSTSCPNFSATAHRSPIPTSRAIVAGLDLDADIGSMSRLFVAGLCGLAYGLADVVDVFRSHGVDSNLMVIGGGAGRSSLVRQIMADTTGLTVALPETPGAGAARSCHAGCRCGRSLPVDR